LLASTAAPTRGSPCRAPCWRASMHPSPAMSSKSPRVGGWDCRCWALGRGGGCCGWLAQVLLCTRLPLLPPPPAMRSPLYVEVHCDYSVLFCFNPHDKHPCLQSPPPASCPLCSGTNWRWRHAAHAARCCWAHAVSGLALPPVAFFPMPVPEAASAACCSLLLPLLLLWVL
jgi:hypothetical protein